LSCCLGSLEDDLFDFMSGRELTKPAKPQTNAQINGWWQTKPNLAGRGKGNLGLGGEETPNNAQRLAAVLLYVITTEVE